MTEHNTAGHPIQRGYLKVQFMAADRSRVTRIIRHDGTPPAVKQDGPFAGRRVLTAQPVWPEPRGADMEVIIVDWDQLLLAEPTVHNLHYDRYEPEEAA